MNTATPDFHARLLQDTAADRQALTEVPIIQGCLRGEVSLAAYVAFLTEAYHHVSQTVPLLRACRARVAADRPADGWLLPALDEYIEEEAGHDAWILDDLQACGADAEAVRLGRPGHATEVMVAYAHDTIARGNPLGFFGMVHVLEGTSVALALRAADRIQSRLGLPDAAFSYLRSHGTLDQAHTAHFELLMDRIEAPADQQAIVHAARAFYRLYADVFRGLPRPQPVAGGWSDAIDATAEPAARIDLAGAPA
jgi:pyrroloquinoline quinone (PQQ) biosynthesis protein C